MRKEVITEGTASAILDAAWAIIVEQGKVQASMVEMARAAGVTRQSVYLAFGSRAGLLIAMARHADAKSPHTRRMAELSADPAPTAETLLDFVEAWLRHLPEIFPVGRILVAAAITDADAAAVLQDRMEGALLTKYRAILRPLAAQRKLRKGLTADMAAEMIWSLTHLDAWRHLVVECKWSPERLRKNRLEIIRKIVLP